MAFNVQNFRAQMEFDGARPNLFECNMTFPLLARSVVGGSPETKFKFMARSSQLPGTGINSVPVMYFGRELKFAGNRTFPEWTVTIINDEDFIIRRAFEAWVSGMNSHVSNLRAPEFERSSGASGGTIGGYTTEGYVYQYGKAGTNSSNQLKAGNTGGLGAIKAYKFVGMFPIEVSPIDLDWSTNDTIEEYTVTFAYQWWESLSDNTTESTNGNAPVA